MHSIQATTSASSLHGGVPTINQSTAVVGGAAYVANSNNFTPAVTHGIPPHQGHVFVEHNNGIFIPLNVHNQIESKKLQQEQQQQSSGMRGAFGASWNFHEDAKDYQEMLATTMRFLRRLRDMVNGLACGFAVYKIMEVYTTDARGDSTMFLASYESSRDIVPKCFLFLTILLLVLSLLPMGFDFAMGSLAAITFGSQFTPTAQRSALAEQQQQPGRNNNVSASVVPVAGGYGEGSVHHRGTTSVSGGGGRFGRFASALAANTYQRFFQFLGWASPADSPFRHLIQVRFVAFLAALAMTIFEIALVDEQPLPLEDSMSPSSIQKLHAAIVTRAVVLLVSWLFSLKDF